MASRFVVQHRAHAHAALNTAIWEQSKLVFTPRRTSAAERKEFATTAHARCTICGAEFVYKERHAPKTMHFWLLPVGLLTAVLFFMGIDPIVLVAGTLVAGLLVGALTEVFTTPPPPYFEQLKGPEEFQHRVRPAD